MTRSLLAALAAGLLYAPAGAQTLQTLGTASATSKAAAAQPDDAGASRQAGNVFDGGGPGVASPPPVLVPPSGMRPVSADLIVGTPGKRRFTEPKSPLTADGKPVEQESGNRLWWGLGGAVVGAGVGFLLGGPIGAAIGAVALGLLGLIFGP